MFGKIKHREMHLSAIGEIVQREWNKSFEIRTELFCDGFVIMPNHIHAILRIKNGFDIVETHGPVETHGRASLQSTDQSSDQSTNQSSDQSTDKLYKQPPSTNKNYGVVFRPPKSISSFVAGFKSSATKRINEFRNTPKTPVWQTRFHDHIIRNDIEYQKICNYIKNNPANWEQDQLVKQKK